MTQITKCEHYMEHNMLAHYVHTKAFALNRRLINGLPNPNFFKLGDPESINEFGGFSQLQ